MVCEPQPPRPLSLRMIYSLHPTAHMSSVGDCHQASARKPYSLSRNELRAQSLSLVPGNLDFSSAFSCSSVVEFISSAGGGGSYSVNACSTHSQHESSYTQPHGAGLRVRGQLLGVGYLLPPCGSRGWNSGGQARLKVDKDPLHHPAGPCG